jgi:hypothetical protein
MMDSHKRFAVEEEFKVELSNTTDDVVIRKRSNGSSGSTALGPHNHALGGLGVHRNDWSIVGSVR